MLCCKHCLYYPWSVCGSGHGAVTVLVLCGVHGCGVVFSSSGMSDSKLMAGEALGRRNAWEPSVYYALGIESFFLAGHDISIRESLDSYGALIWPGVSSAQQLLWWGIKADLGHYCKIHSDCGL